MKMRVWSTPAAVAAVAVVLMAGSVSAAPSEQDSAWMAAAHQSNLSEIAAGNAAGAQATSETVRELGRMFVAMHTQLDADLTAAATQLGVTLPDAPTPAQQQTLASVQAQQRAAFDSAWLTAQVAGHREALQATQTEQQTGVDQQVLGLADAAEPVVAQHLTALEAAVSAGPDAAPLAATGFPTGLALLLATGLITLGAALVVWPRRRARLG
jgi:putative membrane protein